MNCCSTQQCVHKTDVGRMLSIFFVFFWFCGFVSNQPLNLGPVFGLGPFNIDI
jgi:hypothetical protein